MQGALNGNATGDHVWTSRNRNNNDVPVDPDAPLTAVRRLAVNDKQPSSNHLQGGLNDKLRAQMAFLTQADAEELLHIYFVRMWGG
jgi:hypothetical protein